MSGTTATFIATIVSSIITLIGVLVANRSNADKMQNELRTAQAVTNTQIEELTREVREHNNFARRVPVLEEQMRTVNHRIEDLERKCEK